MSHTRALRVTHRLQALWVLAFCLYGQPGLPCTGEARSLDFLVLESSLIVDGEITSTAPFDFPDLGPSRNDVSPCVAEVRVIEVLKGTTSETVLKVRNGPVHS